MTLRTYTLSAPETHCHSDLSRTLAPGLGQAASPRVEGLRLLREQQCVRSYTN